MASPVIELKRQGAVSDYAAQGCAACVPVEPQRCAPRTRGFLNSGTGLQHFFAKTAKNLISPLPTVRRKSNPQRESEYPGRPAGRVGEVPTASADKRRSGRVVEGTVLERRRARKGPAGSDPASSATPWMLTSDLQQVSCSSELSGSQPYYDPVHEDRCHYPTDDGCYACGA